MDCCLFFIYCRDTIEYLPIFIQINPYTRLSLPEASPSELTISCLVDRSCIAGEGCFARRIIDSYFVNGRRCQFILTIQMIKVNNSSVKLYNISSNIN